MSVIAVVVGCVVAFTFIQQIFAFVIAPLKAMLTNGGTFIATEPSEIFMLYLKVGAVDRALHRDAVHPLAALAVHRPRALRE